MKKHLLLIATLLFFASCETTTESASNKFKDGLVILNQSGFPASSTLTHYNPETGTTTQNAFHVINDKELGGGANQIDVYGNHIYIPVNGNALVRILDLSLKEVATVETFESGFGPQYAVVVKNKLAILWTKFGTWGTNEKSFYTLKIYDISANKIETNTINETGTVELPGFAPLVTDGNFVYTTSYNALHKINLESATKTDLSLSENPTDVCITNNNLFVSFIKYTSKGNYGDAEMFRTPQGGLFSVLSSDLTVQDSIPYEKGISKLIEENGNLYSLAVSGEQQGTYDSTNDYYDWDTSASNFEIVEYKSSKFTSAYKNNNMAVASTGAYIRIKYISETESFMVPEFSDYENNGKVNLFRKDGSLHATFNAGVAPVNAVYLN